MYSILKEIQWSMGERQQCNYSGQLTHSVCFLWVEVQIELHTVISETDEINQIIGGGLLSTIDNWDWKKHTFLILDFNKNTLKMPILNSIFGIGFDIGHQLINVKPFSCLFQLLGAFCIPWFGSLSSIFKTSLTAFSYLYDNNFLFFEA